MKSYIALSLSIAAFILCGKLTAQTRPVLKFDLTTKSPSAGSVDGSTRGRLTPLSSATNSSARALEREVFALINIERRKHRLADLQWNESLAQLARQHSQNMAREKFFSHRGSDGSMVDDRADRLGLGNWRAIGENIAYMRGYDNPAELAVEKWLESASHRNNLLGSNWKESAVGVAITEDGTHYFTEVFLVR
jgi:uncharacterized protein YkwD